MEGMLSPSDKQSMVASFLEIAAGQTVETATQFLQATSWKLEDAIQLFFVGNEGGSIASNIPNDSHSPPAEKTSSVATGNASEVNDFGNVEFGQHGGEEVRPPLPVVRETLYDDVMLYGGSRMGNVPPEVASMIAFRNFAEEMKRPGIWGSEQAATSTTDKRPDNLASLYRPPFHLMFQGTFEKAKDTASVQDKWLLVNLQSTREFSSHMLNRDTWANEAVSETVSNNFIFWQVYDDTSEGSKVCTYYKLDSSPVVLIIDPITGQKMRSWSGMVQPESLLEDLVPFLDGGPRDHHKALSHKRQRGGSLTPSQEKEALAASVGSVKETSIMEYKDATCAVEEEQTETTNNRPSYPCLPEEPVGDRHLLCRVGFRLPDGRRVQRNFLKTDPIQLLWSFCCSQLEEARTKPFRLTQAVPGAKILDYNSKLTFEESGLANSMVLVAWE